MNAMATASCSRVVDPQVDDWEEVQLAAVHLAAVHAHTSPASRLSEVQDTLLQDRSFLKLLPAAQRAALESLPAMAGVLPASRIVVIVSSVPQLVSRVSEQAQHGAHGHQLDAESALTNHAWATQTAAWKGLRGLLQDPAGHDTTKPVAAALTEAAGQLLHQLPMPEKLLPGTLQAMRSDDGRIVAEHEDAALVGPWQAALGCIQELHNIQVCSCKLLIKSTQE